MANEIRVAKATYNVLTETNPNRFIFWSKYNGFKILAQGTLSTQSVNADPKTFTLAHGLAFTPNFYGFAKFPDGKVATPNSLDYTSTYTLPASGYGQFDIEADGTNLYFMFTRPNSNYNVDIKYYIFEVPL